MAVIEVAGRSIKTSGWYDTPMRRASIKEVEEMVANLKADSRETAQTLFSGRLYGDVTTMKIHNLTDRDVFDSDTGKIADDSWITKSFPNATLGNIFEYVQGITASGKRKPTVDGFIKYMGAIDTIA